MQIRARTDDYSYPFCQNDDVSYPMLPNQGKSLIRNIFDEAFNQGKLSVVDELIAPNGISHVLSWGMPPNRMGLKQWIAMFRTAFPDLHCTIEGEMTDGAKVAAHWTMRGTHQGLFLGHSPTNKPVVVQGIIYARIENGQIIENWMLVDQMGMLQQIGLVPPPRPAELL